MESHPVPQNITSFEFHLVGDMTLKQFGYLASGLILAYLIFTFFFASTPLIAIPFIVVTSGLGAAFAFLPIYDRPLDHWVRAFIKAIFNPTYGIWFSPFKDQKEIRKDSFSTILKNPAYNNRLNNYLISTGLTQPSPVTTQTTAKPQTRPISPLPLKRIAPLRSPQVVPSRTTISTPPLATPPATPPPTPLTLAEINVLTDLVHQAESLSNEARLPGSTSKTTQIEQVLSHLKDLVISPLAGSTQKRELIQTAVTLKQLMQAGKVAPPQGPQPLKLEVVKKPTGPEVAASSLPKTQIVLTSQPNVVNGIVTEENNNYLEGVIVVVNNSEGLPVRALKTNKLGQFTGATPLSAGVYTLNLEKEGFEFNTLKVDLNDTVLAPMKIAGKKVT